MDEEKNKLFDQLYDAYKKASLVSFGSPDQYQFHQNNLIKALALFVMDPIINEKNNEPFNKES
jgi:predicted protein tyrosine phosphatase